MSSLNIVGAVVTKTGIALYMDDGSSRSISSNDYNTKKILEDILPKVATDGSATLEIESYSLADKVKEATNGAVSIKDDGISMSISTNSGAKINDANGSLRTTLEFVAEQGAGAKGLAAFIENFASIERKHSQNELLTFMKRGDLPICDDGSLLVYKVLKRQGDHFVDCHTNRVPQRVGSIVHMPEGQVDTNRSNLCSTGFHVCGRHYIQSFSGDAIVLCKVKPQHVISVPNDYNGTKMRVMEYFIVAEIPSRLHDALRRDRAMNAESEGAKLIGRVIAGQHAEPIERVFQEKSNGGVVVTPIQKTVEKKVAKKIEKKVAKTKSEKKPKAKAVFALNKTKVETLSPAQLKEKIALLKTGKVSSKEDAKLRALPYAEKLKIAKKLWNKGKGESIRAISGKLGMDRDSLSKNLYA